MTEEDKVYDAVEVASNTGRVKRGVNETTKAVEREKAKIVVIAKDVSPEAITMHLPVLCDEKKIPYVYVPSRKELGEASGIGVPVSALAVTEEGDAKKLLETLKKAHVIEEPKPAEAPKEEKPPEAPKKEEKPKAPKEEKPKEEKAEAPKKEKPKKAPKKEKPKKKAKPKKAKKPAKKK